MLSYYHQDKSKKDRMEEKELQILEVIESWIAKKKCPPTMRELTTKIGFGSTSTTYQYLIRMRSKGLISWDEKKTRTLRILEKETL